MADTFTKDRLALLDLAAADPDLSSSAFRLLFVISSHINRASGDAWPGLDYLAQKLETNERTIRRLIDELITAGYLDKKRGGDGRPNRYRLISDRTKMSNHHTSKSDKNVQSEKSRSDIYGPSNRTFDDIQTGQKCPPNPLIEPIEELFEKESFAEKLVAKPLSAIEKDFGEFWKTYPKRIARGTAEKAYSKARQFADHQRIMDGALRYSTYRRGKDSTYTKHPSTWLNAKCWDDDLTDAPVNPFGDEPLDERMFDCGDFLDLSREELSGSEASSFFEGECSER